MEDSSLNCNISWSTLARLLLIKSLRHLQMRDTEMCTFSFDAERERVPTAAALSLSICALFTQALLSTLPNLIISIEGKCVWKLILEMHVQTPQGFH